MQLIDNLKQIVASRPVLGVPNLYKPFIVRTDASNVGLSGVLYQLDERNIEVPIAYFSRVLRGSEKNYSIFELEFLAICESLTKKFSKYILNSDILVVTDNLSIVQSFANGLEHGSSKIIRFKLKLMGYRVKIAHISGKRNLTQDFLSRAFPMKEKVFSCENKNNNNIVPKIDMFSTKKFDRIYAITRADKKREKIDYEKKIFKILR